MSEPVGLQILRPASPKEWLNRKEASRYLESIGCPFSPGTLAKFVSRGGGPPFVKTGAVTIRYNRHELDAWARRRMQQFSRA